MARTNSPGYPAMALPKAISAARRIFDEDQRNPIDRATAVKHMGYSGPSGAADKALAALAHYGLTEKTGKGEVRVSQLALDIIHPDPTRPGTEKHALLEAGLKPSLFKELRERFSERVSEEALRSYLLRSGFQNIAIQPAMNAYLETCRFLEQERAFESGGNERFEGSDSDLQDDEQGAEMESTVIERTPPPPPPAAGRVEAGETEWMRNPLGKSTAVRILASGSMGSREIGRLIKLLEAQKEILDDEEDDPDDI